MDITQHIPKEFQATLKHLEITDAALAETTIVPLPVLAYSVGSFARTAYYTRDWFRRQEAHPIPVAQINKTILVLAFDHHKGVLKSLSEITLPEDYYEKRLIDETVIESALGLIE